MSDLQQRLRDLHRELAGVQQINPDDRALLKAVLADIQHALGEPAGAAAGGSPDDSTDAIGGAAVRLEAGHPGLAGAVRALVDALAKAGI